MQFTPTTTPLASTCGRYKRVADVRRAGHGAVGKPYCPSCTRRLGVE